MGSDNRRNRVAGQPKSCSQIFGSPACKAQKKNAHKKQKKNSSPCLNCKAKD